MRKEASIPLAGRNVNRVGLGGARWSIAEPLSLQRATGIIELAVAEGVGYLDTARAYTTRDESAHNEMIIARALDQLGIRDEVLVGTKGGHYRDGDDWPIAASPAALRADCEASLRALDVDALDLYYVHYPDPAIPFAESVGAMHELRESGLIRAIGISNVTVEHVRIARAVTAIDAVQNPYSPYRGDREVLEMCAEAAIPFLGYSPLGGSRRTTPVEQVSPTAARLAVECGEDVETVLLAWLLTANPGLLVITGASRPATIMSSTRATLLRLSPDEVATIGLEVGQRVAA